MSVSASASDAKPDPIKHVVAAEQGMKYNPAPFPEGIASQVEEKAEPQAEQQAHQQMYGETKIQTKHMFNTFTSVICKACQKTFTTKASLKRHEERHPLCVKWQNIDEALIPKIGIQVIPSFLCIIEDAKRTLFNGESKGISCNNCKKHYSNISNLNKHYETSIMCNKFALLEIIKFINTKYLL